MYLDDSGATYTLRMNPSGGLVGGDSLTIDLLMVRRERWDRFDQMDTVAESLG